MGVEVRKKEVENRCFGRMHEGCAPPPPLGKRTMARRVGRGRGMVGGGSGEHKRKKPLSAIYGLLPALHFSHF